jgi:hypothetical protein
VNDNEERKYIRNGCKELLFKVVEHGVLDALGYHGTKFQKAAWNWLHGSKAMIPFEYCCEHLGVDPDKVRERVYKGMNQSKDGLKVCDRLSVLH